MFAVSDDEDFASQVQRILGEPVLVCLKTTPNPLLRGQRARR